VRKASWVFLSVLVVACILAPEAQAGQFEYRQFSPTGKLPYKVVATQLTRSGNVDLVFANYLASEIVVLLGNGDGTFQKPMSFSTPAPVALAVGDMNGDGKQDLVVAEYGGTGESEIAVLLGDGTGKFHQSGRYPSGIETTGVVVADFDGDGHNDVAVANNVHNIKVFLGTGEGTLKPPTTYKLPKIKPWAIAAGDLNGDGSPDIAVAVDGKGVAVVFLNDGTGKFGKPVSYDAGGGEVLDVKIADLRHNGKQDLVVADSSRGMAVLLNNGNGTFGKPTIYQPTFFNWQPPEACTVADFNLDGILDVACVANIDDSYFFYGKGDGTFGTGIAIANTIQNAGGFSIASGDFNSDGAPDLAIPIQNNGKVAIMINTQ